MSDRHVSGFLLYAPFVLVLDETRSWETWNARALHSVQGKRNVDTLDVPRLCTRANGPHGRQGRVIMTGLGVTR